MSWICPSCGLALRSIEERETGRCLACSPLQIKEEPPKKHRWDGYRLRHMLLDETEGQR